jgi:hypothetical protein
MTKKAVKNATAETCSAKTCWEEGGLALGAFYTRAERALLRRLRRVLWAGDTEDVRHAWHVVELVEAGRRPIPVDLFSTRRTQAHTAQRLAPSVSVRPATAHDFVSRSAAIRVLRDVLSVLESEDRKATTKRTTTKATKGAR